ncbi:MAG: hypothetical protein J5858_13485 [Lentisphaeria bacterium]|nr:hypothetical protein [Lentisphaeria bacterium]
MNKKTKNLIVTGVIAAVVAIGAVVAYHFYQESQKSGLEKAAEKTVDWTDNAVDKTAKATKDAAKWTDKTATKTADKTKQLFK